MSTPNWSDRDFEELLRRASELGRNQKDSRSSVSRLRAAFSQTRRETAQPGKVWGLVRLALWSVVVLGGIASVGFILARMLLKI
jgi:hypothetical protein